MYDILLTPYKTLLWKPSAENRETEQRENNASNTLEKANNEDWRQSLFRLGAEQAVTSSPVSAFWQKFSEEFIRTLCHIPSDDVDKQANPELKIADVIKIPSQEKCEEWFNSAPLMQGGEYLEVNTFLALWGAMILWTQERLKEFSDYASWLRHDAPRWQQVGRITFNLAENKADFLRPFAFMATYSDGLAQSGKTLNIPLGNALRHYSSQKDKATLIRLLSPVHAAAKNLPWVDEMLHSKEIYTPTALSVQRAYRLLQDAIQLELCGIILRLPNWWQKRQRPKTIVKIGDKKPKGLGLDALVSFEVEIALGDTVLSKEDIDFLLQSDEELLLFKGQWIELDKEKLHAVLEHWKFHEKDAVHGEMHFADVMRLMAGMPSNEKANPEQSQELAQWQEIKLGKELAQTLAFLRTPPDEGQPQNLMATLRPYQRKGFAWLRLLTGMGFGACLADDMGLGKTLQVLALLIDDLNVQKNTNTKFAPSLLIIPASLLGNWQKEAEKFAPKLKLLILHPSENPKKLLDTWFSDPEKLMEIVQKYDLVITTYSFLTRNSDFFTSTTWHRFILDEAQALKNSGTKQAKIACKVQATSRIALTGTPIENRLSDLWSLFNCINPGLLGTSKTFSTMLTLYEKQKVDMYAPLRKLIAPYILRRMKTDKSIIDDLPEKSEIQQYCQLTQKQVKLYQNILNELKKQLQEHANSNEKPIRRQGLVLQNLMRLKQLCNHPSQLIGDMQFLPEDSGKFLRLAEICSEIAAKQEKVLIFTQYQEIIEPLAEYLKGIFHRDGLILHGKVDVKKRKQLVEQFQSNNGPPFFVISLKAGGTGLNLTAASQVIHFDRWWNPAVEDQATDRAFRIGQKQAVFVHKFVTRGTLEEKIDAMLSEKKNLSQELLQSSHEINISTLDDQKLLDLLSLDISKSIL